MQEYKLDVIKLTFQTLMTTKSEECKYHEKGKIL